MIRTKTCAGKERVVPPIPGCDLLDLWSEDAYGCSYFRLAVHQRVMVREAVLAWVESLPALPHQLADGHSRKALTKERRAA